MLGVIATLECFGIIVMAPLYPPQNELRSLATQHFIGRHEAHIKTDARIGDLDDLDGVGGTFMCHYDMAICQGMRDEIEVSHLKECIDSSRFVLLPHCPGTQLAELGGDTGIGFSEQPVATVAHPVGQFIRARSDLIGDFIDAEHTARRVVLGQPIPKGRTKIQSVMQILSLDKDIGIQQVGHNVTPSSRAAS